MQRQRWIGLELAAMALMAACSRDEVMNEAVADASADASGARSDGGGADAGRSLGGTGARSDGGGADAGLARGGTRANGGSVASAGEGGIGLGRGGTPFEGGSSQGGSGGQTGGRGGIAGQAGEATRSGAGGDLAEGGGGASARAGDGAVRAGGVGTGGSGGNAGLEGGAGGGARVGTAGAGGMGGGSPDVACRRAADCPVGNVCGEPRMDGLVYCVPPSTSGGLLGAPCTTGLATTECYDRICPVGVSSRCSRSCVEDGDCTGVTGYVCSTFGSYRFCLASCTTGAQCGVGETCALGVNTAADRWGFVCVTTRATNVPAGTACPTDPTIMCSSGLCLQSLQGNLCTVPCTWSTDCPASLPNCANVTLSTPVAGAAQQVLACTP
jgi:hypothetical protein